MDARTPSEPALETVLRCASLARISIGPEEAARIAPQFARILEAFQVLARERFPDVGSGAAGTDGRTRPDEPRPSLERARVLANAPEQDGEFFAVPKTVGGAP